MPIYDKQCSTYQLAKYTPAIYMLKLKCACPYCDVGLLHACKHGLHRSLEANQPWRCTNHCRSSTSSTAGVPAAMYSLRRHGRAGHLQAGAGCVARLRTLASPMDRAAHRPSLERHRRQAGLLWPPQLLRPAAASRRSRSQTWTPSP